MAPLTCALKIQNLLRLQEAGLRVPPFFVISEEDMSRLEDTVIRVLEWSRARGIGSLIIRSACSAEDTKAKTLAGFFESSGRIAAGELDGCLIRKHWEVNEARARQAGGGSAIFLFAQEYIDADYSGVFFTEDIYDSGKAVILLSRQERAITAGLNADKRIIFDKNEKLWDDKGFLPSALKKEFEHCLLRARGIFPLGAGIEFGLKNGRLWVYQARHIARSRDEEIFLKEKARLKNIFGGRFTSQKWARTAFAQALGNLTGASLDFYNGLLGGVMLRSLLKDAGFISNNAGQALPARCLENIGGFIYWNKAEEERVFGTGRVKNAPASFLRTVFVLAREPLMARRLQKSLGAPDAPLDEAFAWLFLSGCYLEMFLSYEMGRMSREVFTERLSAAEALCLAAEPRPKSASERDLEIFKREFYFWSDSPYEITSRRFSEMGTAEVKKKYAYFQEARGEGRAGSRALGAKARFWLKMKACCKPRFLKVLFNAREELLKTAAGGKETAARLKHPVLTAAPFEIEGRDFPFSGRPENIKEKIIVPGEIDFEKLVDLASGDDISRYPGQYIRVDVFPGQWIPFIPKLKGIVTCEGNEFSHAAITCREFGVPWRVIAQAAGYKLQA